MSTVYRNVEIRVWNDRKFRALSTPGKLLWMFLLTAPSSCIIPGVIVAGEAAIAEEIGLDQKLLPGLFTELFDAGLSIRREGRLVWLPNALKRQQPRNRNQIVGWGRIWDDIPEGSLKHEVWEALVIACKSFSRLFMELFAEPLPRLLPKQAAKQKHQDQDQDQDQDQSLAIARSVRVGFEGAVESSVSEIETLPIGDRRRLLAVIGDAHREAYNRVHKLIASEARPMAAIGDPATRALREYLLKAHALDGLEADLRHALAFREAEAVATRSLDYFGASMWSDGAMAHAKARPASAGGKIKRGSAIGPAEPARHGPPRCVNFGDALDEADAEWERANPGVSSQDRVP